MISKLLTIAVMVSDAKKSAKWYEEKLGFEISNEDDHWVLARLKGANWMLHLCEGELEPGNTGIGLYSDDVRRTVADLKRKGVGIVQEYVKADWGGNASFEDPDGNVIWIGPEKTLVILAKARGKTALSALE
jgi:catechol 2,3-dioxygenase-like lactoylglutathione lyase family enzyme